MTVLPLGLLSAIDAATNDEAEQLRLAQEWERRLPEMDAAAERIRESVRRAPCTCARPPEEPTPDGRCPRCWGRVEERRT